MVVVAPCVPVLIPESLNLEEEVVLWLCVLRSVLCWLGATVGMAKGLHCFGMHGLPYL